MSNMNPTGEHPTSRTSAGLTSGGMAAGTTGGTSSDYTGSRGHDDLDATSHGAGGTGEGRIRDKATRVREQVGQAAHQAREKGAQLRQQVGEYAGNNPILSLALAFIAGVLLTAITRR